MPSGPTQIVQSAYRPHRVTDRVDQYARQSGEAEQTQSWILDSSQYFSRVSCDLSVYLIGEPEEQPRPKIDQQCELNDAVGVACPAFGLNIWAGPPEGRRGYGRPAWIGGPIEF